MPDLDLDALEATASAPNLDRGNSYVTSATTTLALIARIREAEATIDAVEDFVTRHYLDTRMGERVLGILTRHQDKREDGRIQGKPVGGDPSFGQRITLRTNRENGSER